MKKIPEKLSGYTEYHAIKKSIKAVVYECKHVEEFESEWANFIPTFDLSSNEWLGSLYADRQRWVQTFLKHRFWAGMSTTQRSEGMNAFFDGYINSTTILQQFVHQ